jgi:hypothetical protein
MESAVPLNLITCAQCGGELHPDEGQSFLECPYCGSAVYLDKSQVVFHWYLATTLDEAKARTALARWMAGNQTVKDLDKKARLVGISFEFFPLWYFKRRDSAGKEVILLEPAAATSVTELRQLNLPAGDLRKYESSLDSQSHLPTVPMQAALGWLDRRSIPSQEVVEKALVHIPLFHCKYDYQGKTYTAIVEAATGRVFANIFPAKAEAPYLLAGGVTAGVFLCLATWPVIGALAGGQFSMVGVGACIAGGAIAAPFLFALAAWVASKI